jgi:hypothetical protein
MAVRKKAWRMVMCSASHIAAGSPADADGIWRGSYALKNSEDIAAELTPLEEHFD